MTHTSGEPYEWPFELFDPGSFTLPRREIDKVYLHNTGWDSAAFNGPALVEEINRWHVADGWKGVAFHYVVDKAGNITRGRDLEETPVMVKGKENAGVIFIAVQGLWHFTKKELASVAALCNAINSVCQLAKKPVTFHGICEISGLPSPLFDYAALLGLSTDGVMSSHALLPAAEVAKQATLYEPLGAAA